MEIRVSIHTTNPLTGTAESGDSEPLVFAGWVELLHAISTLLGGRAGTVPGAEDAAAGTTGRTRSEDAR
jgi:hypothetical protein